MDTHVLKARKFHDLMPNRVREVLLVSSPYDAFALEEDGHLTEQMFTEYKALSLSSAPRFTFAPTGAAALKLLMVRRFDLVLAMTSMRDMEPNVFGREVKRLRPGRPVILLALDRLRVMDIRRNLDREGLDGVFLWNGDAKILLAIIKFVEDRENVDFDIEKGDVRVILVLEDSPRFYSSYLAMLYSELMAQSRSLYSEGINQLHRLMCMKARPKILHADSFESASRLFSRYRRHLIALICDSRLPRDGVTDPTAGIEFARHVRALEPDVAILIQSAERENERHAQEMRVPFLDKNSPALLAGIRHFLSYYLGFGDFIFRLPDGREVDRARDLRELEEKLHTAPDESIVYHGGRNHFSVWLMARAEFDLAERLRPRQVSEYANTDELRAFLIRVLREAHERSQAGVVADFDPTDLAERHFMRIGAGSLGGKARGIAFLNMTLTQRLEAESFPMSVRVPQTLVVAADHFDDFMTENRLEDAAYTSDDDAGLAWRFNAAWLSTDLRRMLAHVAAAMDGPLAVRSSSLLEDSLQQPFAGIYNTLMIPNADPDPEERARQLCSAVKLVYASTFFRNARSYLANTGYRIEEEKMGVIVERVVGRRYGDRFYPTFSGVAQSYNFYPIGPQSPADGIVHVALGLGRLIVDGGQALRFSPRHPRVLPQFGSPAAVMAASQRGFYAMDLSHPWGQSPERWDESVVFYPLTVAREDGSLDAVGSVYDTQDNRIRDDLSMPGPLVVTFNNILQHEAVPLAETLLPLLAMAEEGLGGAVEIEFAVEMGDWGRHVPRGHERRAPTLYVLQVRPLVAPRQESAAVNPATFDNEACVGRSTRTLGHGTHEDIRDILYVDPARWSAKDNRAIAAQVGAFNQQLQAENRPYLLIGPGRWGSADEWLGIPVQWAQIAGVGVIVEASPEGYNVDPSQGTHFFQNITALSIGYFTIPPGADRAAPKDGGFVDWDWLAAQPVAGQSEHLRHVRLDEPITVVLDGQRGSGAILKPGLPLKN